MKFKTNLYYKTFLFALYLSPVVKEVKYKNACIKHPKKDGLNKLNEDNKKEKLLEKTGLTVEELTQIEVYKNCIKWHKCLK